MHLSCSHLVYLANWCGGTHFPYIIPLKYYHNGNIMTTHPSPLFLPQHSTLFNGFINLLCSSILDISAPFFYWSFMFCILYQCSSSFMIFFGSTAFLWGLLIHRITSLISSQKLFVLLSIVHLLCSLFSASIQLSYHIQLPFLSL